MDILSQLFSPETVGTIGTVVVALFAVSEALALIPSVKANSVFQLVYNTLKTIREKFSGKTSA